MRVVKKMPRLFVFFVVEFVSIFVHSVQYKRLNSRGIKTNKTALTKPIFENIYKVVTEKTFLFKKYVCVPLLSIFESIKNVI